LLVFWAVREPEPGECNRAEDFTLYRDDGSRAIFWYIFLN